MTPAVLRSSALAAAVAFAASALWAAEPDKHTTAPPPKATVAVADDATILKGIRGPKDFDVTVFAKPPQVSYPTVVSATGDGVLFVGIDEQGSLGKEKGRGRVVRCVDTDQDGKADQFTTFAKMDHPRGLFFDAATDTLIVLHPPLITAFTDKDGDGVSDKSEVLATGIADAEIQKKRGADHTTNGFRLGIDGWLYIAQGDFGSTKAVGKDGSEMTRHGGGVTRIRIDGSGVETYSTGQRNIYDVAVDPLLNCFTRDNTNDGDGWDVRLSYVIPGGYYGYPSAYKHFKDEMVAPLAELGGGSPVGALFLAEPGFAPDLTNAFYSVEWGRQAIYRHPLEASGAGFKAVKQEEFMGLPKAVDMDADGVGNLYAASWVNGGFNYSKPDVGYVVRMTPKGGKAAAFPDLKKATDEQLVTFIASPSAVLRQYAQREILKRGATAPSSFQKGLESLASSRESVPARVAALFTLKQLLKDKSTDFLVSLTKQDDLRELALRALCDVKGDASIPAGPFVEALADKNPRVRLIAAWGLARLNKTDAAQQMLPLVADADPLVSHTAIGALVSLKAAAPALAAVDNANPTLAAGALKVLQKLHDTQVVDALIDKLKQITDPTTRANVLAALCRLHGKEAAWDGSWWGTRPDSSGPYYKAVEWEGTAKVRDVLKAALASEKPEIIRDLVLTMAKNKVDFPELLATLNALAAKDPTFRAVLVDLASNRPNLTADQVALLKDVAASDQETPATRVKAIRTLQKRFTSPGVMDAAVDALAAVNAAAKPDKEVAAALLDFVRDNKLAGQIPLFTKLSTGPDAAERDVAMMVLANLSTNKLLQKDKKVAALSKQLDDAWAKPEQAASLLRAAGRLKLDAYKDKVAALQKDANPQVAAAANEAAVALNLAGASKTAAAPSASAGTLIEKMKYEDALAAALAHKGDAKLGAELFTKLSCAQCHTVSATETPKGPYLGDIFTRYGKGEVVESILRPNAKVTQGFETQWFTDKEDETVEGFVTRDAGDELDVRNIVGVTVTLKKSDIKERGKRELSAMPENLLAKQTPRDLAAILAYMEAQQKTK